MRTLNSVENKNTFSHLYHIAEHFEVKVENSNNTSTIRLDNHKAKGFISTYQLFQGLSVLVYNITFQSDFQINLELLKGGQYYFCYSVKGRFFHRFGNQKKNDKILHNHNMFVTSGVETSAQVIYPANIKHEIVIIIVDLQLLEKQNIRNAKGMCTKIKEMFSTIYIDKNIDSYYKHIGNIDPETEKYAQVVCENNNANIEGRLLTEAAVINMFVSQIKSYKKYSSRNNTKSHISKEMLFKITNLEAYIIENFQSNLTMVKLTKKLGITPKKLQDGINHLYGYKWGVFVFKLRMKHAKHLFDTTDLNVTEVRELTGIASASHFSIMFKKEYGILPSQYKIKKI